MYHIIFETTKEIFYLHVSDIKSKTLLIQKWPWSNFLAPNNGKTIYTIQLQNRRIYLMGVWAESSVTKEYF